MSKQWQEKEFSQWVYYDAAEVRGALTLYMDFINLFINLLQLFGDRK